MKTDDSTFRTGHVRQRSRATGFPEDSVATGEG